MNKVVSKILMVSMVSAMLFSMVGCGPKEEVEEPSVTPPIEDVQNPTEDTQKPVEVNVNMDEIVATIQNTLGENYLPNMIWSSDEFNEFFDLTGNEYSEVFASVPMMSTQADKLFIVKTNDTDAIRTLFDGYFRHEAEEALQYPMNLNKLNNYKVAVYNDYVLGFVLGGYSDEDVSPEATDEEIDAVENSFYESQNEKIFAALDSLFVDGYTGPEIPENILTGEIEDADAVENTEDAEDTNVTEDTDVDATEGVDVVEDAVVAEDKNEADTAETAEGVEITETTEETPVEEKVVEDTDIIDSNNSEPTEFVE